MTSADLPAVGGIAEAVHPSYPEDAAVFAERLALYPRGCHVLDEDGALIGYVISHPWAGDPPALNSLLHALPAAPTTYYIHDLALLPAARGIGAGRTIVAALRAHAGECRLATLSLVAVNRSEGFWRQLGFHTAEPDALHDKLESYGADARVMRLALAPPNGLTLHE